jgi:CxxC motif-containing protein (DUF1111 family)
LEFAVLSLVFHPRTRLSPLLHVFLTVSFCITLSACGGSSSGSSESPANPPNLEPVNTENFAGGDATTLVTNGFAFSENSANITEGSKVISFNEGNHFFENPWVPGSQSTKSRDGLGPYFNNDACQDCHINDGRGHAAKVAVDGVSRGTDFASMLIRVSKSQVTEAQQQQIDDSLLASVPDTTVGNQLQHRSMLGVLNEAELAVSYNAKQLAFADGTTIALREPIWHMTTNFDGGNFNTDSVFSARVSPPMIGLGLLEAINEADITSQADPSDANNDGISGRANRVYSLQKKEVTLGRFGWKAGQPSLIEQTAGAFIGDMGLTSFFHPDDNCNPNQADCIDAPNGTNKATESEPDLPPDDFEVVNGTLQLVSFYTHHLAVPVRRDAFSADVQAGKDLFFQLGCEGCHTQTYVTGTLNTFPELSDQTIFPYTDMLLHNMGEALADFDEFSQPVNNCELLHADEDAVKVEFQATACEWRTPPLWGLGLTKVVDDEATFLHDGRAETIMEAVLWHGGEAEASKQKVLALNAEQRRLLLAFLNDL